MHEVFILGKRFDYEIVDDCWICVSHLEQKSTGYTKCDFKIDGKSKTISLHRATYMHYHGEIKGNNVVMHSCDDPMCFNPDHLSQGTRSDNTQDMIKKGRANQHIGRKRSKLTPKQIEDIKVSELSSYQLAKIYPVSSTHIRRIRNGTRANKRYKQKQYKNENPSSTHTIERSYIAVEIDY